MKSMTGQVVVVTGGSQGIGEALAKRFTSEGASVAILNRNEATAARVVDEINRTGGRAVAYSSDVGDVSATSDAVRRVLMEFGTVDVLVNNAGLYFMSPAGETAEAACDAMLAVNIKGPFFLIQALLPEFRRKGRGKVINIGSIFGNDGFPGSSIYCATKAAIHMMTKSLALELRAHNIQINAIAPGWVETPLNEHYRATNPEFMRRARERFGAEQVWMKPEELTGAAVFLASSDSDSVTGATLFVDRGWSAY